MKSTERSAGAAGSVSYDALPDSPAAARRSLVITRTLDAPRTLVWKAWTDPELVKRWWGPQHFTSPACTIDLRVGGRYHFCMRSPDGADYWSTGVYREIVEPERIVFTDSFADEHGNVVPATHYGMSPDFPLEMLVTITFEEERGKTLLTLTHQGFPEGDNSEMASQGWNESLDKLAGVMASSGRSPGSTLTLPSDREIVMERVFAAPRERVFQAYTDPAAVPLWWGPRGVTTVVDKMDVRPGGAWRYVQHGADGAEYAFNGVYQEVVPPERIVSTFEFEMMPGHVVVDTVTFAERDGKTLMSVRSLFASREDRDGMIESGMEGGANESWDRFAELLSTMVRAADGVPGQPNDHLAHAKA